MGAQVSSLLREQEMSQLTLRVEENRKALVTMLGKLYITANSSAEKLWTIDALVTEAIDEKIAGDAASRNALNKLETALSKAMGEAGKAKKTSDETLAPDADEGLTVMEAQEAEEPVLADEGDVKMEVIEDEGIAEAKDTLLEELLDDEDEDL